MTRMLKSIVELAIAASTLPVACSDAAIQSSHQLDLKHCQTVATTPLVSTPLRSAMMRVSQTQT